MPASLRLFAVLAAVGATLVWLGGTPAAIPPPPPPDRPVGAFGGPRFASAAPVEHVAYSPDGQWLAGTGRGEVRLWDAACGRLVRRIAFGDAAVGTRVAFTRDGRTVLVLAVDDVPYIGVTPHRDPYWPVRVYRFDAATGVGSGRAVLAGVDSFRMYGRPDATFTPDGSGVMLMRSRFSTASGRPEWAVADHWLSGAAVSPDGAVVAAVDDGGTLHLLDAATGAAVGRLSEPTGGNAAVAFSADGKRLATAHRGHGVVVWDAAARTPVARLTTAPLGNTQLALSPSGDRVAVAECNGGVRVYDVATGRVTVRSDSRLHLPVFAFSPDGSAVAVADGHVTILDAAAGDRLGATGWSPRVPPQFRFADESRVHVRTGPRGDIITYKLPSGREVGRTADDPAAAAALGFTDGRWALRTGTGWCRPTAGWRPRSCSWSTATAPSW